MPQSDFWPFKQGHQHHKPEASTESTMAGDVPTLQRQLCDMEGMVKEMQTELAALRKGRMHMLEQKQKSEFEDAVKKMPEENYKHLQDTRDSRLVEELIRAKNSADEERFHREKCENKLRDLETKLTGICSVGNYSETPEQRKGNDIEITNLKNQIRDLKEELEEARLSLDEKDDQVQEYRAKYLQAQQHVEELKRQLDVVDFDNKQVSDQIQMEIQKMKLQFQEKLHELTPLPDLLKSAQIELQEAKQLQKLAEDSSHQLSNELQRVKDKLIMAVNCLTKEKNERSQAVQENIHLKSTLEEKQKEIDDLTTNLDDTKCSLMRLDEKLSQQEYRFKEKAAECLELLKELDQLKHETTRTLSRTKERADAMKKYLQTQISELERQLVQSRAQCRACQKDRDEVRQRMQIHINNLQESFELVELKLRTLQGQVSSLKNTYALVMTGDEGTDDYKTLATV